MIRGNITKIAALAISFSIAAGAAAYAVNSNDNGFGKKSDNKIEAKCQKHKGTKLNKGKFMEKLGITKEDMIKAEKSGKNIFDLAKKKKGLTPDQVREIIIKDKAESIDVKVKEGKLTKDEAEKIKAKITERVRKWDGSMENLCRHHGDKNGMFNEKSGLMRNLELTTKDIDDARKSGKTIFDLAKEKKNMAPDQVKTSLIKEKTERIDKAVSEGKISKEKADEMKAKIKERIQNWDGKLPPKKED